MKKILILTAGFGEGHNSAARGIRDGLRKVSPEGAQVELHDLFAETYGAGNDWGRVLYMGMINRTPRIWRRIYQWLDRQETFAGDFRVFFALKNELGRMLRRFQPDVIVSVYPAYSHMLDEIAGLGRRPPAQTRGGHHRFDQRQRDLVSLQRRLFSPAERAKRGGPPRRRHSSRRK